MREAYANSPYRIEFIPKHTIRPPDWFRSFPNGNRLQGATVNAAAAPGHCRRV
jgi:hypothetical protein